MFNLIFQQKKVAVLWRHGPEMDQLDWSKEPHQFGSRERVGSRVEVLRSHPIYRMYFIPLK